MFKKAVLGDKVFSPEHGVGEIISVDFLEEFPLRVLFRGGDTQIYMLNGNKYQDDKIPSLFWSKPEFPKPPLVEKVTEVVLYAVVNKKSKRFVYSSTKEKEASEFMSTMSDECQLVTMKGGLVEMVER